TYDGLPGVNIRFIVVHTSHLAVTTGAIDETAEVVSCSRAESEIAFTMGLPGILRRRFPRDRYSPSFCRHHFGDAFCKYQIGNNSLTSDQIVFVPTSEYNRVYYAGGGFLDLVSGFSGYRVCRGNLVANAGFEQVNRGYLPSSGWLGMPYPLSWSLWGGAGDAMRRVVTTPTKYDRYAVHIVGYGANAGIKQVVAGLAYGKTHRVSCWCKVVNTDGSPNGVRIEAAHPDNPVAYATGTGDWEQLTFTLPASASNGELKIFVGGEGSAYFDCVSVTPTAELRQFDRFRLRHDAIVTIAGSASNDGEFVLMTGQDQRDTELRGYPNSVAGIQTFHAEEMGETVTITAGFASCDHTIAACRMRNNSVNFGGSPGMQGGVYG
ncbi:MAG: phage BR0599 family protein, partial [Dehalococcoidales bacterium]|nr:phage BR0599 family protein [Dehalococcoidales bacterium]